MRYVIKKRLPAAAVRSLAPSGTAVAPPYAVYVKTPYVRYVIKSGCPPPPSARWHHPYAVAPPYALCENALCAM
ncbi:MAG: hypothetical protein H6559_23290 [Lewinellaceae bacterium]|nr:hypothetical protein [Lewinellaceae bacterium]